MFRGLYQQGLSIFVFFFQGFGFTWTTDTLVGVNKQNLKHPSSVAVPSSCLAVSQPQLRISQAQPDWLRPGQVATWLSWAVASGRGFRGPRPRAENREQRCRVHQARDPSRRVVLGAWGRRWEGPQFPESWELADTSHGLCCLLLGAAWGPIGEHAWSWQS